MGADDGPNPLAAPGRVLVVDDDQAVTDALVALLTRAGHDVRAAYSSEGARAESDFAPDVVLADFYLPDGTGLEVLELAETRSPGIVGIIVTGYETAVRRIPEACERWAIMGKPVDPARLVERVGLGVARARLRRKIETGRRTRLC